MTHILVTGGSGFIGSHLVEDLAKSDKVVIIQRDAIFNMWLHEALAGCIRVRGDVLDQGLLRRVISDYNIDQIYHLAAQAVVSAAYKDPVTTFAVNVVGTANLLEVVAEVNKYIKVLVQSTDKVFGDNRMNMAETDALLPTIGIYETSKACQDWLAQSFAKAYDLDIRITRAANVYGFDTASRIIPNTICDCIKGVQPVLYEGQENTVRQYIYIGDMVNALELIMTQPVKFGEPQIFNIGTDDILTQEEVVKTICAHFSMTPRYVKREKPFREIQKQSVNWEKLKNLGWKPSVSFDEGIKRTIGKFQQYKEAWLR